jgi:diguanylate cyclase (GGDEF)-like protein
MSPRWTIRTRAMALLLAAAVTISAATWLAVSGQRDAATRLIGQDQVAGDLLTAMLDEETGLRGYSETHERVFLGPYLQGTAQYTAALHRARRLIGAGSPRLGRLLRAQAAQAQRWQKDADDLMAQVAVTRRAVPPVRLRHSKLLMDRYRTVHRALRDAVRRAGDSALAGERFRALAWLLAICGAFSALALVVVGRRARADGLAEARHAAYRDALLAARTVGGIHQILRARLLEDAGAADVHLDDAAQHDAGGTVVRIPTLAGGEVTGAACVVFAAFPTARQRRAAEAAVAEASPVLAHLHAIERAEARAVTDALTGCANRRAWDERLPIAMAVARRSGRALSIALIDLDGFKALNDSEGHEAGDRVLRACTVVWQRELRIGDVLARVGGDEFATLLPECGEDDAAGVAQRLRETTPHLGGASVGIAEWDREESPDAFVRRADAALYADKAHRRAGVGAGWAPTPAPC